MGYQVEPIPGADTVFIDFWGRVTLDERNAMLDEQLFWVRRFDLRQALVDLSMMTADNCPVEALFFAETLAAKAHLLRRVNSTVILPGDDSGTKIVIAFMRREALRITEARLELAHS